MTPGQRDNNNLAAAWKLADKDQKRKIEGLLFIKNKKFVAGIICNSLHFYKEDLVNEVSGWSGSYWLKHCLGAWDQSYGINFLSYWVYGIRGAASEAVYKNSVQPGKWNFTENTDLMDKNPVVENKKMVSLDEIMEGSHWEPIDRLLGGASMREPVSIGEEKDSLKGLINTLKRDGSGPVLSPREMKVLWLRFWGVDKCGPGKYAIGGPESGTNKHGFSLEVIGAMLGVTRERIRQIEIASLKKLKKSFNNKESEK